MESTTSESYLEIPEDISAFPIEVSSDEEVSQESAQSEEERALDSDENEDL